GLDVVVTGTEPERDVVATVRERMRQPSRAAVSALSLGGLCALLAAAAVVVSNDTGPLHLANAVGAPTVGIFWIGNLVNGAPLNRTRHRPLAAFRTHCPVCGSENTSSRCDHDSSFVDEVTARAVVSA